MRKVDDGKKRKEKKRENNVVTNIIASRPPKRRPTGTPHARAKSSNKLGLSCAMFRQASQLSLLGLVNLDVIKYEKVVLVRCSISSECKCNFDAKV